MLAISISKGTVSFFSDKTCNYIRLRNSQNKFRKPALFPGKWRFRFTMHMYVHVNLPPLSVLSVP